SVEVVIDLRGAVDIQDFTLGNPARLVVDLQGARLVAPAVLYDGANRGGIKNIRYAQFRPGVVRIVIDLDALKDYQIERRDGQVRVKIGSERTAFEAWSSRSVASAPPAAVVPPVAQRAAGRGGQAARVATPAQSGDGSSIDAYLAAHASESAQSQAARITVTWDNADLREVVAGFAAFSGRTIIVSKDVKGQVSAEIKNQPWDLAFNAVLESQGLAANVLDGGIIQVIDKRDLARADSTVPVETRLVRVNYAKASALVPSVASILTKRGQVVADSTSNALVITEIASRITRVEEFVKGPDIRTPQVSIQANLIFSTAIGNFDLTTFLQALQRVELADVQAEPTITTLDNRPAEILVGDRVPIRVIDVSTAGATAGAVPRATVRFEQTGIYLKVTPH